MSTASMTIEEMLKHKQEAESRLASVAKEVVDEFQRRTGVYVGAVYVQLVVVSHIGDAARKTTVECVSLDLKF